MEEGDGSENPFLRLYMKQLSLNWAVLSSILSHLSMVARALSIQAQDRLRPVPEEAGLSTHPVPKVSISEVDMARTPYVTVRGDVPVASPPLPQPKETIMVKDEEDTGPPAPKPVDFDDEKANSLLDIVHKTRELPSLAALNASAMTQLAMMAKEVQDEMAERGEEYQKAMAEWKAKQAKEERDAA